MSESLAIENRQKALCCTIAAVSRCALSLQIPTSHLYVLVYTKQTRRAYCVHCTIIDGSAFVGLRVKHARLANTQPFFVFFVFFVL